MLAFHCLVWPAGFKQFFSATLSIPVSFTCTLNKKCPASFFISFDLNTDAFSYFMLAADCVCHTIIAYFYPCHSVYVRCVFVCVSRFISSLSHFMCYVVIVESHSFSMDSHVTMCSRSQSTVQ